ncbi:hypothetical protein SAMN05421869_132109 [Nonomuraea jiangxiensis]|uniref:Uncharacterized protein n=1 Tax=Nonomuraea jiangxiensis TaxID=633440 RepID=A0A1G9NVR6_9ACTN|nr:hypothetical protein SAMN05421869_132109 [Nonomuraea jiangxiensis]
MGSEVGDPGAVNDRGRAGLQIGSGGRHSAGWRMGAHGLRIARSRRLPRRRRLQAVSGQVGGGHGAPGWISGRVRRFFGRVRRTPLAWRLIVGWESRGPGNVVRVAGCSRARLRKWAPVPVLVPVPGSGISSGSGSVRDLALGGVPALVSVLVGVFGSVASVDNQLPHFPYRRASLMLNFFVVVFLFARCLTNEGDLPGLASFVHTRQCPVDGDGCRSGCWYVGSVLIGIRMHWYVARIGPLR